MIWTDEQRALRETPRELVRREVEPHLQESELSARLLGYAP